MPDPERVLQTLQARLAAMAPTSIDWNLIAKAGAGLSYADLVWACDDAAKDAVLNDRTEIATRAVVAALQRRHKPTRQ